MPLKELVDQGKMLCSLLKGQVLSHFEHYVRRRLEAEDAELVIRDIELKCILRCAICM
jgi:hypothetical protein